MAKAQQYDSVAALVRVGISHDDASALRRISMMLRRWFEAECGTDAGAIERDEKTGKPFWTYDMGDNGKRGRTAIPDREKGARLRLETIMKRYPALGHYVQGDPRGASLYILRPGDVPEDGTADAYYSRGIVVCR